MVNFPKVSPNLIAAVIGLGVVAVIVNQVRNAGKDIANFGKDFKPLDGLPQLPSINFPAINISNPFNQAPQISADPTKQTTTQQKEIFGKVLTKSEEEEINKIAGQIDRGEKVTVSNPESTLLNKFNPPNVFGFGILGENKKGISTTLANELGISNLRVNELSAQQIKILENIDIKENTSQILEGRAGVNAQNFFNIFNIPFTTEKQQEQNNKVSEMIKVQEQQQITPTFENNKLKVTSNVGNFKGGGVSFIGGSVNETPIKFLSLGQIIDKFGVSASKARDLQFQARNEGKGFDFGTNTGNALNLSKQIRTNLPSVNVSNPAFEGKTTSEIAAILINGSGQGLA